MVIERTTTQPGAGLDARLAVNAGPGTEGSASGVCKLFDAETITGSAGAKEQARQQVFDILAQQLDLSVSLHTASDSSRADAALSAACEILADAARDAGVKPGRLQVVIDNPSISPERAATIRREQLGEGLVYIVASDAALRADRARGGRDFWRELWEARNGTALRIAYASPVRASSLLLRSEPATAVLPRTHIEVPAGTAWVQFRVSLADFLNGGRFCTSSFEQALRNCVGQGERIHDEARWATPQMRDDAWLNRRLAVSVVGIGDLVAASGRDPAAFSTLEYLGQLLQSVRRVLCDQTRAMATRSANLPALEQTDPCRYLPPGEVRDAWRRRWAEMLATAAVRHRNLLVLAPWSIFPAGRPADFRYANLLPILRFADTCTLAETPDICHWNVKNFRDFHCRASAALHQREARYQIAEGC